MISKKYVVKCFWRKFRVKKEVSILGSFHFSGIVAPLHRNVQKGKVQNERYN